MVLLAAFNQEIWTKLMAGFGKTLIPLGFIIAFLVIAFFLFVRAFQFNFSPWSILLLMLALIGLAIIFYLLFSGQISFSMPNMNISPNQLISFLSSDSPVHQASWGIIAVILITVGLITALIIAPLNARVLVKAILISLLFFLLYVLLVRLIPVSVLDC